MLGRSTTSPALLASRTGWEQTRPVVVPFSARGLAKARSPSTSLAATDSLGTVVGQSFVHGNGAQNGDVARSKELLSCGRPQSWSGTSRMWTESLFPSSLSNALPNLPAARSWRTAGEIDKTVKFGLSVDLTVLSMMLNGSKNCSSEHRPELFSCNLKQLFSPAISATLGDSGRSDDGGCSRPDAKPSRTWSREPS